MTADTEPKGGGCPFCRILDGDPDGQVERRYPTSVVITPLNPVAAGHKLVIPLQHVADAVESAVTTSRVMADAATYAAGIGPCNIITSVGKAATQTVFHMHVHVVPRCLGDGLRLPWTPNEKRAEHPWELQ